MSMQFLFLAKVWRRSGRFYIRLPADYTGAVRHNQRVRVKLILSEDEQYTVDGVVKLYKHGCYVKLPPEAEALWGKAVRVRLVV